uniref:Uncharacterized protein n=1 Tax=Sphaerodactylus townsendi TaxID=933632 RepID=A0ACB8EPA7_9SAUR
MRYLFPSPAIKLSADQDVMTTDELEPRPVRNEQSSKDRHRRAWINLQAWTAHSKTALQSTVEEEEESLWPLRGLCTAVEGTEPKEKGRWQLALLLLI